MAQQIITKNQILKELEGEGTIKEIAAKLGISTSLLKEGIKTFNIKIKRKSKVKFIDDTIENTDISSIIPIEEVELTAEETSTVLF